VSPLSAPEQPPPPPRPPRLFQLGGQPGHIRLEPPRSACSSAGIGYGPQFIEHDGDVSRHADLIGCGMAGLSLLDGALDVNGEGVRQDGQDACDRRLTARTVPMTATPIIDVTSPIASAGEPDRGDIVLPAAELVGMGKMMSVYAIEADTRPQTVAIAVDVDRRAAVQQDRKAQVCGELR
jgi:hypothetical protein